MAEPERGSLVVTGPDRKTWLNGIVSCDVTPVAPGAGAWGLALTKQGKILSDLSVVASEDTLYLATAPGTASELAPALDRMLVMEDAELSDGSAERAWIFVHGPRASELAPAAGGAWGAIDWTGLGGAAISVARSELEQALRALVDAGATLGQNEDWERLRIERLVPRWGVDYDAKDNPHEAALDQRAVSWTKGCYLGQEVVCMQDMRGKVKRRLALLSLDANEVPERGAPVRADDREVGEVTSATFSQRLGRPLVLARVQTPFDEVGRALSIAGAAATSVDPGI